MDGHGHQHTEQMMNLLCNPEASVLLKLGTLFFKLADGMKSF
jgi:hypothetical protein